MVYRLTLQNYCYVAKLFKSQEYPSVSVAVMTAKANKVKSRKSSSWPRGLEFQSITDQPHWTHGGTAHHGRSVWQYNPFHLMAGNWESHNPCKTGPQGPKTPSELLSLKVPLLCDSPPPPRDQSFNTLVFERCPRPKLCHKSEVF